MFDLIFRQIQRHKRPLFLILLSWLLGAYLIYQNHHQVFAYLSYFFSSPSLPQKQKPAKAYKYIKRAQLRLKEQKIDLSIMEKSCKQLPIRYRGDPEQFTPDWLESLKNWKLTAFKSLKDKKTDSQKVEEGIATMPDYWKEKHTFVLLSLRDAIDAMQFAYEINTAQVNPETKNKKIIVVPRLVERYAKALCKDHLALLAWGEYLTFQERRAGQDALSKLTRESLVYRSSA